MDDVIKRTMLTRTQESRENRPSSRNSHQTESTMIQGDKGKTSENAIPTMTQESNEKSSAVQQKEINPIEINGQFDIYSVAFLVNEKHVVSGGYEGKIRRWRVEDGEEVGMPMDAGNHILSIAVSRDGKWIVSGTKNGLVTVWNAESGKKVTEFTGHMDYVRAADVSSDGTRIVTGSDDKTACVWSLSTGKQLLGPLKHDRYWVVDAKFSPDGCLVATATLRSVRVYENDRLLIDVNFTYVKSVWDKPLAWASDAKQLFALSYGNIHCLDGSTGTTLSKWPVHSSENVNVQCIALANDNTFIAASAGSSVSLWSTTTHNRIGSVIEFTHDISSMAISPNYDLVIGGKKTISLFSLCNILPSSYFDVVSAHASILMRQDGFLIINRSCRTSGTMAQVRSFTP